MTYHKYVLSLLKIAHHYTLHFIFYRNIFYIYLLTGDVIKVSNDLNKPVFFSSAAIILLVTIVGSFFPTFLKESFSAAQSWLTNEFGWVVMLAVATILFVSLWLMIGRLGDIKLGPDDSEPEYSSSSWFAMLFSAGMGIGLLFFGVAEPIMHYSSPPVGEALSIGAAKEAMKITFFHWGLHAWAVYGMFAVILAYFSYRKNLPLLPRSAFYPMLGEKIHGAWGDMIDTFAVVGTMFGVATSLGLGVSQVNAGLSYLIGIPQSTSVQIALITAITLLATASVVLGLDGGIKKLSNLNMILAVLLLGLILAIGETTSLIEAYVQNSGAYLSDIIYKTFNLYAYQNKKSWIGGWTVFYWTWWIAWAPFVGIFIARISRGRTIREFLLGVLLVPSAFTFLWMTVFGNSAISISRLAGGSGLVDTVTNNVPVSLFKFLSYFPSGTALSILAVMLVVTFFVSSSDSGSLVIDTLTSGGSEEPPVWQRIFWALTEGVVAAVLLVAGGLEALQTMTIISSFPIVLMMLLGAYNLVRALQSDRRLLQSVKTHTTSVQMSSRSTWQDRLSSLTSHPSLNEVNNFLRDTVKPSLRELSNELLDRGHSVKFIQDDYSASIVIVNPKGFDDFLYQVKVRSFEVPSYSPEEKEYYARAEVFLSSGGQGIDIFGYTKDQILGDAITQYEKHFHFLHMLHGEVHD